MPRCVPEKPGCKTPAIRSEALPTVSVRPTTFKSPPRAVFQRWSATTTTPSRRARRRGGGGGPLLEDSLGRRFERRGPRAGSRQRLAADRRGLAARLLRHASRHFGGPVRAAPDILRLAGVPGSSRPAPGGFRSVGALAARRYGRAGAT